MTNIKSIDERLIIYIIKGASGAKEIFNEIESSRYIDGYENKELFEACHKVYNDAGRRIAILQTDKIEAVLEIRGSLEKIPRDKIDRIFNAEELQRREMFETVNLVKERYINREKQTVMKSIQNAETDEERTESIAQFMELDRLKNSSSGTLIPIGELLNAVDRVEQMPDCVPTGFPLLDARLGGGLVKGAYHLIVAPTGTGKTILMLTMWKNMIDMGIRSLYINYEVPRDIFIKYMFAQFTGLNVMHPNLDVELLAEKKLEVKEILEKLNDDGLLLVTDPLQGSSEEWARSEDMIRTVVEKSNIECVFFDTVNSVTASTKTGQTNRWNEYEKIAMEAEKVCMQLNVAIVFSSQPKQDLTTREEKTPQLMDVAGSKALSEKAASITHLHRADLMDPTKTINYSELHIVKNRVMGQEMGSYPIRVKYNHNLKNLYELPSAAQGLKAVQLLNDDMNDSFIDKNTILEHPMLSIGIEDGEEL